MLTSLQKLLSPPMPKSWSNWVPAHSFLELVEYWAKVKKSAGMASVLDDLGIYIQRQRDPYVLTARTDKDLLARTNYLRSSHKSLQMHGSEYVQKVWGNKKLHPLVSSFVLSDPELALWGVQAGFSLRDKVVIEQSPYVQVVQRGVLISKEVPVGSSVSVNSTCSAQEILEILTEHLAIGKVDIDFIQSIQDAREIHTALPRKESSVEDNSQTENRVNHLSRRL